jgi:hypothetical protein
MPKDFTTAEVRRHLLGEMDLTEEKLGTAVLKVIPDSALVWTWDYADSMTHDHGTVKNYQGMLLTTLAWDSSSYSEGWTPND